MYREDESTEREIPFQIGNPNVLFGAYAISAAMLAAGDENREVCKLMKESGKPIFRSIGTILLGYLDEAERQTAEEELGRAGFTAEQQAFARRWLSHEIELVRCGRRKQGKRKR